MKNDFDFIKDRVENSGVNAPAHMDESYVLDRIADSRPQTTPAPVAQPSHAARTKKRRTGRITAIAAAVVAVAVLGTALTVHFTGSKKVQPIQSPGEVSEVTGLIRFSSYDEVNTAVDALRSRTARYERNSYKYLTGDGAVTAEAADDSAQYSADGSKSSYGSDYAPVDNADSIGSDNHSDTYKQVDGVDEADRIKTDGRYIYVVDSDYSATDYSYTSRVSIFPAAAGVTDPILRIIPGKNYYGAVPPSTADEATPDEPADDDPGTPDDVSILELYLAKDRMIILCSYSSGGGYGYRYGYQEDTRAYVYDIADMNRVRLLDTFTQSGSYTSSRMIGDTLYLVTNQYEIDSIPFCGRGDDADKLAPDCIYSVENPTESSFLIVSAYDTRDYTAATDSKAVLGLGSDVYCSRDNLYIAAADYSGFYRLYAVDYAAVDEDAVITYGADDGEDEEYEEPEVEPVKTKIFKVSLDGGVSFTAYGEVEGTTNNQYSFDEYNGYLRVATTSANRDYEDINNLYVLDGSLDVVGSVTGFAATESIKAVRYVGNTAYVITYEQTDPLFVIDLSSPTAPTILGEVKISGFSTMLVPIDGDTILGLGTNTGEYDYTDLEVQDGFKLALFDVSDKSNPQVLDSRSYVNYSSEVMWNPKALVYNPVRGDYIVPLDYYYFDNSEWVYDDYYDVDAWENWYDSHVEQYSAVLNFRVEDGRIAETELHILDQPSIDRCVYVGDTVFAVYFADDGGAHLESFSYL